MHVQWDGGQTVKTLSALILALAQPSGVKRFFTALVWERMCWPLLAPLLKTVCLNSALFLQMCEILDNLW